MIEIFKGVTIIHSKSLECKSEYKLNRIKPTKLTFDSFPHKRRPLYPSDFKMQNSELSSRPLGKEGWRRNVGTFQTNLTLHKGLDEAPEGQVKTSFMLR